MAADTSISGSIQDDEAITELLNDFKNMFIAERSKTTITQINQRANIDIDEAEESPISYSNKIVRIAASTAQSEAKAHHIMASWAPKYLSWFVGWELGYEEAMQTVVVRMGEIAQRITQNRRQRVSKLALQRRLAAAFDHMAPKYGIMVTEETKISLMELHLQMIKAQGMAWSEDLEDTESGWEGGQTRQSLQLGAVDTRIEEGAVMMDVDDG